MREFKRFVCEICKSIYEKEEHARQCKSRRVEELKFQVGDFCEALFTKADKRWNTWWRGKRDPVDMKPAQVVEIRGPYSEPDDGSLDAAVLRRHGRCTEVAPPDTPHVFAFFVRCGYFDEPLFDEPLTRCPLAWHSQSLLQSELVKIPTPQPKALKPSVRERIRRFFS